MHLFYTYKHRTFLEAKECISHIHLRAQVFCKLKDSLHSLSHYPAQSVRFLRRAVTLLRAAEAASTFPRQRFPHSPVSRILSPSIHATRTGSQEGDGRGLGKALARVPIHP